MYRNRLIPCLLLHGEGLVKTKQFKEPNYLGDPINAVRLFNDKLVDELILLDIDATREKRSPNFEKLEKIIDQCFMPITYGGGISSVEDIKKLLSIGIEKVAINYSAYSNPEFVREAVSKFGSSTVVGGMDVGMRNGKKTVKVINNTIDINRNPIDYAKYLYNLGVGEILLNDIHNDGMMMGYDYELVSDVSQAVTVPVVACGGAANLHDCQKVTESGASAAAAGSIFVYYGRLHAVLINYPEE